VGLKVELEKMDMKISNYLWLALDVAVAINVPQLTKRIVCMVYNHLLPYYGSECSTMSYHVFMQLVLKAHHAAILVEGELIEQNMRRVISSLSYWAARFCFQFNEHNSLKNLAKSEFHLLTRKWRRFAKYEVRRPELTEE